MVRNNFQYEKRQRELEKKRKAEEKARRKLEARTQGEQGADASTPAANMPDAAPGDDGEHGTRLAM